jgi:uncharacterized membrane protein YfcA
MALRAAHFLGSSKADRKATAVMVAGALIGVPIGTYFLSRLEPVRFRGQPLPGTTAVG